MNKVKLGDRFVPPIGIGTWNVGNNPQSEQQEIDAIQTGLNLGAQVIDTAEMYGNGASESLVGKAIKGYKRDEIYLISKILPENAAGKLLAKSLDQSLKRLNVDYLDMYLLHWQGSIPLEDTVVAMEEARKVGKIKSWGVSNLDVLDLEKIRTLTGGQNNAANQVKYNLIDRGIEYDLIPYMQNNHLPLIAYSPIFKGDFNHLDESQKNVLETIADNHQASISQIMLAWTIRDQHTVSIPKSSNPDHMSENIKASSIQLNQEELDQLDQVFKKPDQKQNLALW